MLFTPKTFRRVAEQAGFTVEHLNLTEGGPFWAVGVLSLFEQRGLVHRRPGEAMVQQRLFGAACRRLRRIRPAPGQEQALTEPGHQVDEVDPLRAPRVPVERRRERVAVAGLGAAGALGQPDGLPVGDVHGGQQLEASVVRRLLSSPAS